MKKILLLLFVTFLVIVSCEISPLASVEVEVLNDGVYRQMDLNGYTELSLNGTTFSLSYYLKDETALSGYSENPYLTYQGEIEVSDDTYKVNNAYASLICPIYNLTLTSSNVEAYKVEDANVNGKYYLLPFQSSYVENGVIQNEAEVLVGSYFILSPLFSPSSLNQGGAWECRELTTSSQ